MNPGRVLIFANPIAGRGLGEQIAVRVRAALRGVGFDADTFLDPPGSLTVSTLRGTVSPDGGRTPAAAPVVVVVIGGDGTLRVVAHRLAELRRTSPDIDPAILMIPLGTANLMCRHLGLSWDDDHLEQQVVEAVQTHQVAELDTASANGQTFLLMVGVGFDAAVVHELSRVRRGPISYASYLAPAAKTAARYSFPPLTVEVDGRPLFGPAPAVVFVGNVPEYGTGFPMLPRAQPTDGLLDVCVLPCANLVEAAQQFLMAAAGEHVRHEGTLYVTGKRVRIDAPGTAGGVPIQIDGDAAGHTPVDIELLSQRLRLVVP